MSSFIFDKFARRPYPLAAQYTGLPRFGAIVDDSGVPKIERIGVAGAGYDGVIELNDTTAAANTMGSLVQGHHQQVEAGGALNPGDKVASDNVGRAILADAGKFWGCVCRKAVTAAGQVTEVDFTAGSGTI